jgi:hypothetical protein
MDGIVVIGEGEKDAAPMLYCGEAIGDGSPPFVDIAVDPLDGTTLTAQVGRGGRGMVREMWRGRWPRCVCFRAKEASLTTSTKH